jgi:hypothetical protein
VFLLTFFRRDGGCNGPYGEFFLKLYSGMLLDHGKRIQTQPDMNLQKSSHPSTPVHNHEHFQHLPPTVVIQEHHLQLHKQQQQRSHQFEQQTPK